MSAYLDTKYLLLISTRLRNFKRKGTDLYNFSCPFCGDSSRDRRKARGYVFRADEGKLLYHCQRCAKTSDVWGLLREVDDELCREYRIESFADTDIGRAKAAREADFEAFKAASAVEMPEFERPAADGTLYPAFLTRVTKLPRSHRAAQLILSRKIPCLDLYHTEEFKKFTNSLIPDKYKKPTAEARLVIPFYREGRLIGFQGRSYEKDTPVKYLTVCLDKDVPFFYGWDEVDHTRPIKALEGPIDSMFLPNAVATAGGSISREVAKSGVPAERWVIVYDNEPRAPQTVKKMRSAVEQGFGVCIWPEHVRQKDVNDMILAGYNPAVVSHMIDHGVKFGLEAELAITTWRKCDA